ncbi:ATP synthase F1 subunit delta [Mucilaginibacter sp. FT3.2]|uniref:ATP synthase F1 subunit delta n=1 Tax=Mucilaginibacter sp. FT3.2 TaxID=2723090 RepID=UPI00160B1DE7|nr:ATP synthase F1 subunit delta [Mucilaginibacter sp. FT3.2]MBB6232830.1 F-type H+-transporting ATPase subunit delta [Mucilaginibacter sp. FT3.2]
MSELTVAARYAKSLIDLAQEQNSVEAAKTDMELFVHTLKANPQLAAVLANPVVAHTKKLNILDLIFAGKVNKLTLAFFKLMVNKGRGEILGTTGYEFVNLYNLKNHITKATVVSAKALSEANKSVIAAELQKSIGGTIQLATKVDASLIGGFILTVGDRQLDSSVTGTLNKLKKEFAL